MDPDYILGIASLLSSKKEELKDSFDKEAIVASKPLSGWGRSTASALAQLVAEFRAEAGSLGIPFGAAVAEPLGRDPWNERTKSFEIKKFKEPEEPREIPFEDLIGKTPLENFVDPYLEPATRTTRVLDEPTLRARAATPSLSILDFLEPHRLSGLGDLRRLADFQVSSPLLDQEGRFDAFSYSSSQCQRIRDAAMSIFANEAYMQVEAQAVAQACAYTYVPRLKDDLEVVAQRRYHKSVVPAIANAITGLTMLGRLPVPEASAEENFRAYDEQVNRVDLCPLQVMGTLRDAKLKDAYVDGVVRRAEVLLDK